MRSGFLVGVGLAALLGVAVLAQGASAAPVAGAVQVEPTHNGMIENVHWWHGKHYRYRWHGRYWNHRYYRHHRWHYW